MTDAIEIWPGRPYPLGAAYDGGGTNFSLFSEVAESVELCLFDDDGGEQRIALDLLLDPDIGIVSLGGRAGTGKSALALCAGLLALAAPKGPSTGTRQPG